MLRDFLHVQLRLHDLVHNHRGMNVKKRRIIHKEEGGHLKMTFWTQ
jgi:hypothetical protein